MPNFFFNRDVPSLNEIRNEFDRLLDKVWHGGLNTSPLDGQDWAPPLDVIDEPLFYRVRIEVPGLTADQVEVTVHKNVLTVKGTKASGHDPQHPPRTLRSECRFGAFHRQVEFPTPILDDGIKAACRNGVLTLEIPKTPVSIGRTVRVEDAG